MGRNDLAAIQIKVQQRKLSHYVLEPKKSVQSLHWVEAMKDIKENVSVAEMKVCVCEGWGEWKRLIWSKDIILVDFWSDTEALLVQLRHILQKNTEHTTDKILLFTLFNTSQHKESPAEVKHTIVSNIARSMYTMLSLLNIVRIIDNPSTTLGHHSQRYEDL